MMKVRLSHYSQIASTLKRKLPFSGHHILVQPLHAAATAATAPALPIADNSLNNNTPYNLCFVRHGQSTWNRDNRFIGWTGEF